MLEIVEELGPGLACYDLGVRHLLELLQKWPSIFDRVEEQDEGLGWWHAGSDKQNVLNHSGLSLASETT